MNKRPRKHYPAMIARMIRLFLIRPTDCSSLVEKSYDRISSGYDHTWTSHMRELTEALIGKTPLREGHICLDLTCGTGFATNLLAQKVKTKVTGVDRSAGMLHQARLNYGDRCEFIQSDVLEYLKKCEPSSIDVITCCWGMGYSKPLALLRQIKRVLKPGGCIAIIDNSLFSIKEIIRCSFLTFAEQPGKLRNLMRFRFLPGSFSLRMFFRLLNMKTLYSDDGSKSYTVASGTEAIERLRATGAAAGFEYAAADEDEELIFNRFAEIVEEKCMTPQGIKITHRYLAGIARK